MLIPISSNVPTCAPHPLGEGLFSPAARETPLAWAVRAVLATLALLFLTPPEAGWSVDGKYYPLSTIEAQSVDPMCIDSRRSLDLLELDLSMISTTFGKRWLRLNVTVPLEKGEEIVLPFHRRIEPTIDIQALISAESARLRALFTIRTEILLNHRSDSYDTLSDQEKMLLAEPDRWPGYSGGLPLPTRDEGEGCPPVLDDAVEAVRDAIIYSCRGTPPSISCDCHTDAPGVCGGYRRDQHMIYLCADKEGCPPGAESRSRILLHEYIHALQSACGGDRDWGGCYGDIRSEFQAYLCAGQCTDVVGCCLRQAYSIPDSCGSLQLAVLMCLREAAADPDLFFSMERCCPNIEEAHTLSPCNDLNENSVCDAYECSGSKDKNLNGICDTVECEPTDCPETCDADSDGVADRFSVPFPPPMPTPTAEEALLCAEALNQPCSGMHAAERDLRCKDTDETITELECCDDSTCTASGRCWKERGTCKRPARCNGPLS